MVRGFWMINGLSNISCTQLTSSTLATERFSKLVTGYNWTIDDTYAAQTLCAYDTVSQAPPRFYYLFHIKLTFSVGRKRLQPLLLPFHL